MTTLELLSPAKNLSCGISAIDHGADAVYIGADRFGARAAAGNSLDDIKALCDYAHQYDARVYVTVNTVIYDNEVEQTIELCKQLHTIGVDALLLQDMGILSLLSKERSLQGLNLHASTQTDNRTIEKVRWLASQGFKRVVLARELSLKEIEEIHANVPEVELEVFVHGALCVSYSGQCYASQYCFGRSANRGECAQFCRLPFTLQDANGNVIEQNSHILSLKDMAQINNLEKLALAGAVSFKIEGRLKDADYVKNVTAAYSERLNEICRKYPDRFSRLSMGKCSYTFKADIQKSFNRGFTTYFFNGRQKGLVSPNTPKAIGEYVGKTKDIRGNFIIVSSTKSFNNGDGLCFFNSKKELIGFRVNKAVGNKLFPLQMPRDLRTGMELYRNHDQEFDTLLSKTSAQRKIAVKMLLYISDDTLSLHIIDEHDKEYVSTESYVYSKAEKPQKDNICRQLTKLGGTPYICNNVEIKAEQDIPFIQNSILSQLKRACLSQITSKTNKNTQSISNQTNESILSPDSLPAYPIPYLYNATNEYAKSFYKSHGVATSGFEKEKPSESLLMQCRYCIRYELGYCTKTGRKAPWKEPLILSLNDGKTFRVKFNCKNCQMEIWT